MTRRDFTWAAVAAAAAARWPWAAAAQSIVLPTMLIPASPGSGFMSLACWAS